MKKLMDEVNLAHPQELSLLMPRPHPPLIKLFKMKRILQILVLQFLLRTLFDANASSASHEVASQDIPSSFVGLEV